MYNTIKCSRSIEEVNTQAEAISAKVRFPGRIGHATKNFDLLQKKNI